MRFLNEKAFNEISVATSVNSQVFDISHIYVLSIHGKSTGVGANGSYKLQVSNQDVAYGSLVTDWVDYPSITQTIAGTASYYQTVDAVGARWARLVFTTASGTGTLSVWIMAKGN
jgi:hypothetical protein